MRMKGKERKIVLRLSARLAIGFLLGESWKLKNPQVISWDQVFLMIDENGLRFDLHLYLSCSTEDLVNRFVRGKLNN